MENIFCSYSQSLILKELGFNKYSWFSMVCSLYKADGKHTFYANGVGDDTYISAPLKSQVFEWFRKEYGYWSYIKEATKGTNRFYIEKFDVKFFNSEIYESYEESEFACINKLIELVVNKQI